MNKYCLTMLLSFFMLVVFPASALETAPKNEGAPENDIMTEADYNAALIVLNDRIEQLKEAKKAAKTKIEKKEVRDEIKAVKKEVKELKKQVNGAGIYIGSGALVVILLLILLL